MSTENIIQMYKDYKKSGGFGIYMVDELINKNIQYTDIPTLLEQEQKLIELYNKKKEQAFRLSRTNRKEGDRLEKEANDILNKIDKIK